MSAPKVDNAPPLFTPREINLSYGVHFTAAIAVVTLLALGVFGHFTGASGARIMGATLMGGTALTTGPLLFILRRHATKLNDENGLKYNKFRQQLVVASFLCAVVFGILGITGTLVASDVANGFLIGSSLSAAIHVGYAAQDKKESLLTAMFVALVVLNALGSCNVITGDTARYLLSAANMVVACAYTANLFHKMSQREAGPNDPIIKKFMGLDWLATMVVGILGAQGTLSSPSTLANTVFLKTEVVSVAGEFTFGAKPEFESQRASQ